MTPISSKFVNILQIYNHSATKSLGTLFFNMSPFCYLHSRKFYNFFLEHAILTRSILQHERGA